MRTHPHEQEDIYSAVFCENYSRFEFFSTCETNAAKVQEVIQHTAGLPYDPCEWSFCASKQLTLSYMPNIPSRSFFNTFVLYYSRTTDRAARLNSLSTYINSSKSLFEYFVSILSSPFEIFPLLLSCELAFSNKSHRFACQWVVDCDT
jgi:hypothetical protein